VLAWPSRSDEDRPGENIGRRFLACPDEVSILTFAHLQCYFPVYICLSPTNTSSTACYRRRPISVSSWTGWMDSGQRDPEEAVEGAQGHPSQ